MSDNLNPTLSLGRWWCAPPQWVRVTTVMAVAALATRCRPYNGGACPDSGDLLDASVLGPRGAEYGSECDALCPGDVPLGSVEGTVAVICSGNTCELNAWFADPQCAFAADLEAWQAEKCPECALRPYRNNITGTPYPATCTYDYDYLVVLCDSSK